jgi:hypothetical protein
MILALPSVSSPGEDDFTGCILGLAVLRLGISTSRKIPRKGGDPLANRGNPARFPNFGPIPPFARYPAIIGRIFMSLLLIVVLILLIFGGGGGYYAHRSYGGAGLGGVLGVVVVVLLVLFLFGGLHA